MYAARIWRPGVESFSTSISWLCYRGKCASVQHPYIDSCLIQLTARWKDIVGATAEQSTIFNIPGWLSRALLDAIGEGKLSLYLVFFFPFRSLLVPKRLLTTNSELWKMQKTPWGQHISI